MEELGDGERKGGLSWGRQYGIVIGKEFCFSFRYFEMIVGYGEKNLRLFKYIIKV